MWLLSIVRGFKVSAGLTSFSCGRAVVAGKKNLSKREWAAAAKATGRDAELCRVRLRHPLPPCLLFFHPLPNGLIVPRAATACLSADAEGLSALRGEGEAMECLFVCELLRVQDSSRNV